MSLETYGFDDFERLLLQLAQEFGYTEVNKRVLIPAVKAALKGTDKKAQALARKDTGKMASWIRIDARRPDQRDLMSKYVKKDDAAIAVLSAKLSKISLSEEFGTANKAAHPFIRPTFESSQAEIIQNLSTELGKKLERYQARKNKDRQL
jgi:HK97 gp10 family phage protein